MEKYNKINFLEPVDLGKRDWGKEELLGKVQKCFTFKKLSIKAGNKGGLQYHRKKDEMAYLLSGKLKIRYLDDENNLIEKICSEGESFHFPPFSVHQEEAITDCVILEVSTPFLNDRVRVEHEFGLEENFGLPTTRLEDIIEL